jgi:hypothetical protein
LRGGDMKTEKNLFDLHLLTFSSLSYTSPGRFERQARESGFFSSIRIFSDNHIGELRRSRPIFFRVWKNRGFGFWIWKPATILQRLRQIPENDYLIYLDQGFHIQKEGQSRLFDYIKEIESSNSWIGVFSAGENYRAEFFVRQQAVRRYYPEFYECDFGDYVYAGILIIKNSLLAREAIQDWRNLCEDSPIWAPIPFTINQRREFIGQDGDNGYLPLVLSKWGGYHKFSSVEINKINHEGFQLQHVLPAEEHKNIDWGDMSDRPFLLKRDR